MGMYMLPRVMELQTYFLDHEFLIKTPDLPVMMSSFHSSAANDNPLYAIHSGR